MPPDARTEPEGCPLPVELLHDRAKQQEFLDDYHRLESRVGFNALSQTFLLYLLERRVEAGDVPAPGSCGIPRESIVGQKNTAEIIARWVERGWADFYLSDRDFSQRLIAMDLGGAAYLAQPDGGQRDPTAQILREGPSANLLGFVQAYNRELGNGARLVPADRIRETFAEIDRRYALDDLCQP